MLSLIRKHKILFVLLFILFLYLIFSNNVFASTTYNFNSSNNKFYCNTSVIPEAVYDTLKTISYYNDNNYHCVLYRHVYPFRVLFFTANVTVQLNNRLTIPR